MDIIKFTHEDAPHGFVRHGDIVQNVKKKMWVERFDTPGEFTLESPLSSNLRQQLPIGTLISHIGTGELMMVEDHEISSESEGEPTVKVTGRSLYGPALENRIHWDGYQTTTAANRFKTSLPAGPPESQIQYLIDWNLTTNYHFATFDYNSAIYYSQIKYGYNPSGVPDSPDRELELNQDVLSILLQTMKENKVGLKSLRPGAFNEAPFVMDHDWTHNAVTLPNTPKIAFMIHSGEDKRYVVFSHANGDIKDADYLWSNRTYKTIAIVVSKWFTLLVAPLDDSPYVPNSDPASGPFTDHAGLLRRTLMVDGSEFDNDQATLPAGGTKTAIVNKMKALGESRLKAQKSTSITRVEAVDNLSRWKYRRDFDIGDYIRVEGEHDTTTTAQIMEYVEIQDEEGERGYPTLRIDNDYVGILPI